MTPLVTLAVMLGAFGLGLVAVAVRLRRPDPVAALVEEFEGGGATATLDPYREQLRVPLLTRALGPLAGAFTAAVARVLPRNAADQARHKLVTAGLTSQITVEEFLAFRLLAAVGGGLLGIAAVVGLGGVQGVAAAALLVVIGLAVPRGYVDRARDERVRKIERELPDSLDLLAISVEAGLGFEQALAVVVARTDGVLAAELGHTLKEMQLGRSRAEALHELQRRVDVQDVHSLVLSLVQADALGMPLTRILRTQAAELRRRRRQRVREAAAKLPVKMILPMALFILPALFVVVLGPAVLTLMRTI